jgi:hypothetical protein
MAINQQKQPAALGASIQQLGDVKLGPAFQAAIDHVAGGGGDKCFLNVSGEF